MRYSTYIYTFMVKSQPWHMGDLTIMGWRTAREQSQLTTLSDCLVLSFLGDRKRSSCMNDTKRHPHGWDVWDGTHKLN